MRWGALLIAVALMAPASAGASTTQRSLIQDDDQFLYNGPKRADESLDQVRDLGVDLIRVSVHWGNVARKRPDDPTDPAGYPDEEFDAVDHVLRAAKERGIGVLVTVTGPAPDWAARRDSRGRRVVKPDPGAYAQFVEMLGRRWSGSYVDENQGGGTLPRVEAWSTWNEPNWHSSLMPQWSGPRGHRRPFAGKWFRLLHRAAVAGLERSGHGGDTILIGETAPLGSIKRNRRSPLKPGVFLRQLFCLRRDLRPMRGARARRNGCDFDRNGPLKATGYAHHPYPILSAPGEGDPDPDRFKLADTPELVRLLDAAAAAGRVAPQLPLWFTEFGWQTEPDPVRGIPLLRQARWLGEAERMSYNWPRVAVHGNFLLRDDEPRTSERTGSPEYWATWQSGLLFADGTPKPAYDAFRLPLVAPRTVPRGAPLELFGIVRTAELTAPTRVLVQRRPAPEGQWETLGEVQVPDPSGFTATIPDPEPGDYRLLWTPPAPPARRSLLLLGASTEPTPPPVASSPVYVAVE